MRSLSAIHAPDQMQRSALEHLSCLLKPLCSFHTGEYRGQKPPRAVHHLYSHCSVTSLSSDALLLTNVQANSKILRQPKWKCRLMPKKEAKFEALDLQPHQGTALVEDGGLLQSIAACVSKLTLGDLIPAQAQRNADSTAAGPSRLPSYLKLRME